VTWSTSASDVATVSATGVVTAIAAGNAVVTATSEGRSASAAVEVTPPGGGIVDRVELDAATISLEEGDLQQLTATAKDANGNVIAGRFVRWTSSDEGVMSVNAAGIVTAVRAGQAVITARVDGKTATATARVTTQLAFDLIFDAAIAGVRPEIFVQDTRDAQSAPMRLFEPGQWAADAMASPDGRTIAVAVSTGAGDTDLYLVKLDAPWFTRLTSGSAADDQPVWSPDGSRIAFRRFIQGVGPAVWVIDVVTGVATNLTGDQDGGQFTPAWSPDGQRIAYAQAANGVAHLWTMRADGTDKQEVTRGDVWDDQPAWSPNGTTLVFQRTAPAVFGDLYLVNATGGDERKLLPFADLAFGQFAPAWSPDGRLIAFSSKHEGGTYQIYTVWADGSKLARRTNGETNKQSPAWISREAIGYPTR
jgi:Tol biopolymer transport system component